MRVRFQADWDLDGRIIDGLRLRKPAIDFCTAAASRLMGVDDPDVFGIAASAGRVTVSQDRASMPFHFARFVLESRSAGLLVIRRGASIADVIELLITIWECSEKEEWIDRLEWIPF